jgi:hypothetical protein
MAQAGVFLRETMPVGVKKVRSYQRRRRLIRHPEA